jgi:hypothetical protein
MSVSISDFLMKIYSASMVTKRQMELKWNKCDLLEYISVLKNVMSKIIEMLNPNSLFWTEVQTRGQNVNPDLHVYVLGGVL